MSVQPLKRRVVKVNGELKVQLSLLGPSPPIVWQLDLDAWYVLVGDIARQIQQTRQAETVLIPVTMWP